MAELPHELIQALREFGFSEEKISNLDINSTVLGDLRISGDDFETLYKCISKSYNSNALIPEHYIPSELSCDSLFLTLGNLHPIFDKFIKAPPLSLMALNELMRESKS